jgi:hypothetical protein
MPTSPAIAFYLMSYSRSSQLFPVCERYQLVQDFLQPLQPPFVIPRRAVKLFATLRVEAVRFSKLRYFVSQLCHPFFDGILHGVRL